MAQKPGLPPVTEDQFRDAILKKLTDKDTAVDSTLKKFVQLVEVLQRKKGEPDEEVAKNANLIGQSILREVEQFKLDLAREELSQKATELDIEHYESVYKEKEAEIVKVRKEIDELRETLAQERSKKKNKEEYLALAKLIHELPKRSESEKAIDELKTSLTEVESRNQDVKAEYEEKSRQYQLLLYAINMLTADIGGDKDKEKEKDGDDMRGVKRKLEASNTEEMAAKKHKGDDKA